MTLEIIDHAFCPPESPFYAKLLRLKLESLRRHAIGYPCRHTTVAVPGDELTWGVWGDFCDPGSEHADEHGVRYAALRDATWVTLRLVPQPPELFFQRATGREFACRNLLSTTKIVWFSDLDQIPTDSTLNWLCDRTVSGQLPELSYPATYWIDKDHATGMRLLESFPFSGGKTPSLDAGDFEQRTGSPIGGLYFVMASVASEGYLSDPESKWQRPTERRYWDTPDDRAYRKQHEAKGRKFLPVPIPGIHRIRHFYGHLPGRAPEATK